MKFRRPGDVPRGAMVAGAAGTAAVHGAFIALLILSARAGAGPAPIVYSVELVAAPLPSATTAAPTTSAPTPPAPPTVTPKPVKKVIKAPVPKPPAKVDPTSQPAPPVKTPVQPVAGATPGNGTDVDNVRVEGKAFPHPEYLRNLMNEILRRWARPAGSAALEAEVSFTIFRDGSVRDIKVVRSSRSYPFDLEAQGAVEQAAQARAFGPLPRDWPSDILQVAFLFTPRKPQ